MTDFSNDLKKIEKKWQREWEKSGIFEAEVDASKPKFFITFAYPYINGRMHIGHAYTFTKADIYARFKRMQGYNVLFAQGFHATGQPIVAAARLVKEGNKKKIKELLEYGIKEHDIKKFEDPKYWIKYFSEEWKKDLKAYGASVDWRRTFITTELNPNYDAFIRWQYNKLREKGLVEKGKHPVVWCPKDKIPVGDHDRSDEYVGIAPEEIVVIYFSLDGKKVPVATYRPETIYGVTNLWVNADGTYVEAEVNGTHMIISKEWSEKLKYLGKDVNVKNSFKGGKLIGKKVENPVTGEKVPILGADFVDTDFATGVVMSVPAHAPYDWIGLVEANRDLLKNARSLIKLDGFSEFPARDLCEKYGIKSSKDVDKLERATQELYKKEYYEGTVKDVISRYSGKKVSEVKDTITKDFIQRGIAEYVWILPKPVICRCGEKCTVKLVEQWFLKYSDEKWKNDTKAIVEKTAFVPDEVRGMVLRTVDWLRDWACTRDVKTSLGTKLPWDETQYVESLSDSTIYMAYYTVAKYADDFRFDDKAFDFIFYGKGVAENSILENARRDFEYWYPVDARFTGKDLIQNHVTFSIFHHAALFPDKYIKKWIVNGFVLVDGEKMSKSKGNSISVREVVERYGSDPVRFSCAYAGNSVLDDANIEIKIMKYAERKLKEWFEFCRKWYGKGDERQGYLERWLENSMNRIVNEVMDHYEMCETRDVINKGWYGVWGIVEHYIKRTGGKVGKIMDKVLIEWVKILHPVIPHITEEIWRNVFGFKEFLVKERLDRKNYDEEIIKGEEYIKGLLDDVKEVIKLVGEAKEIVLVPAEEWKYKVIEIINKGERNIGKIVNAVDFDKEKVAKFAADVLRKKKGLKNVLNRDFEIELLKSATDFFERELGVTVAVKERYEHPKIERAMPSKPAIIVIQEQ